MDEQKKKMLMIGGVVAVAVVVIIAAAVMMDHKKKVEQSPMIVNRGSSGTLVSTLATTAQGITTIPAITVPIQKKYYIQSTPATGSLYLICEFGKSIATTKLLSEATPVTFTKCANEYCLMSGNQNVKISPGGIGGIIQTDGVYTIYIHSLSETTYLGLLYYPHTLALSPFGFGPTSASDATIWNVVTN
jgi:hypothetical protein